MATTILILYLFSFILVVAQFFAFRSYLHEQQNFEKRLSMLEKTIKHFQERE